MLALIIWLQAFGWTLLIELPVAAALAPRGKRWLYVGVGVAINLTTHPLVTLTWFGAQQNHAATFSLFLLLEAGVVLVETVLWRISTDVSWRRALLLALATNVPSAAASPLVSALLVRPW